MVLNIKIQFVFVAQLSSAFRISVLNNTAYPHIYNIVHAYSQHITPMFYFSAALTAMRFCRCYVSASKTPYCFHWPAFSTPLDTSSAPLWTPVPTELMASPTGLPADPVALVMVSPTPRVAAPTTPPAVRPTPPATLPTVLVTNLAAPVTPESWSVESFSGDMFAGIDVSLV